MSYNILSEDPGAPAAGAASTILAATIGAPTVADPRFDLWETRRTNGSVAQEIMEDYTPVDVKLIGDEIEFVVRGKSDGWIDLAGSYIQTEISPAFRVASGDTFEPFVLAGIVGGETRDKFVFNAVKGVNDTITIKYDVWNNSPLGAPNGAPVSETLQVSFTIKADLYESLIELETAIYDEMVRQIATLGPNGYNQMPFYRPKAAVSTGPGIIIGTDVPIVPNTVTDPINDSMCPFRFELLGTTLSDSTDANTSPGARTIAITMRGAGRIKDSAAAGSMPFAMTTRTQGPGALYAGPIYNAAFMIATGNDAAEGFLGFTNVTFGGNMLFSGPSGLMYNPRLNTNSVRLNGGQGVQPNAVSGYVCGGVLRGSSKVIPEGTDVETGVPVHQQLASNSPWALVIAGNDQLGIPNVGSPVAQLLFPGPDPSIIFDLAMSTWETNAAHSLYSNMRLFANGRDLTEDHEGVYDLVAAYRQILKRNKNWAAAGEMIVGAVDITADDHNTAPLFRQHEDGGKVTGAQVTSPPYASLDAAPYGSWSRRFQGQSSEIPNDLYTSNAVGSMPPTSTTTPSSWLIPQVRITANANSRFSFSIATTDQAVKIWLSGEIQPGKYDHLKADPLTVIGDLGVVAGNYSELELMIYDAAAFCNELDQTLVMSAAAKIMFPPQPGQQSRGSDFLKGVRLLPYHPNQPFNWCAIQGLPITIDGQADVSGPTMFGRSAFEPVVTLDFQPRVLPVAPVWDETKCFLNTAYDTTSKLFAPTDAVGFRNDFCSWWARGGNSARAELALPMHKAATAAALASGANGTGALYRPSLGRVQSFYPDFNNCLQSGRTGTGASPTGSRIYDFWNWTGCDQYAKAMAPGQQEGEFWKQDCNQAYNNNYPLLASFGVATDNASLENGGLTPWQNLFCVGTPNEPAHVGGLLSAAATKWAATQAAGAVTTVVNNTAAYSYDYNNTSNVTANYTAAEAFATAGAAGSGVPDTVSRMGTRFGSRSVGMKMAVVSLETGASVLSNMALVTNSNTKSALSPAVENYSLAGNVYGDAAGRDVREYENDIDPACSPTRATKRGGFGTRRVTNAAYKPTNSFDPNRAVLTNRRCFHTVPELGIWQQKGLLPPQTELRLLLTKSKFVGRIFHGPKNSDGVDIVPDWKGESLTTLGPTYRNTSEELASTGIANPNGLTTRPAATLRLWIRRVYPLATVDALLQETMLSRPAEYPYIYTAVHQGTVRDTSNAWAATSLFPGRRPAAVLIAVQNGACVRGQIGDVRKNIYRYSPLHTSGRKNICFPETIGGALFAAGDGPADKTVAKQRTLGMLSLHSRLVTEVYVRWNGKQYPTGTPFSADEATEAERSYLESYAFNTTYGTNGAISKDAWDTSYTFFMINLEDDMSLPGVLSSESALSSLEVSLRFKPDPDLALNNIIDASGTVNGTGVAALEQESNVFICAFKNATLTISADGNTRTTY